MTTSSRGYVLAAPVLALLALGALGACDDGPGTVDVLLDMGSPDLAPCHGGTCPLAVGAPVVIGAPASDALAGGLSLGASADGKQFVAAWVEAGESDSVVKVAASGDGAKTFAAAHALATPSDAALSAPRVLVSSAGVFVSTVASVADADPDRPSHAWVRVYQSTDQGASFSQKGDLKSVSGDRSFSEAAFAGSTDGATLVAAWVDTTPDAWLAGQSLPAQSILASTSTDGGATFSTPVVALATPYTDNLHLSAFLGGGKVGISHSAATTLATYPAPIGTAFVALASPGGAFAAPTLIGGEGYAAVPATTAPAAAIGSDGSIHIAWWSAKTVGIWYAVSHDGGGTFSAPVAVFETALPTPGDVSLVVDGAGTAWIAAEDEGAVRLVRIAAGGTPSEVADAGEALAVTASNPYASAKFTGAYALAPLPGDGVVLAWIDAGVSGGSASGTPTISARVVAPR